MKNIVKKYNIELSLLVILIGCVIIYIFVKTNSSEEKGTINREDLFEYENSDIDIFYSKINRMRETDYKEKQIVSIRENVRVANFYKYGNEDSNYYIRVDSAYMADSFCGFKSEDRKYLVLYLTIENLSNADGILFLFPQRLQYYNKRTSQVDNSIFLYGNTEENDYGMLYLKDVDRGVIPVSSSDRIKFEKNDYNFQYIFVPANDNSRVKIVYPLDSNDTRLFNTDYEFLLNNNASTKEWYNTGYMIKIPFDEIQQINNVNDGWDDEIVKNKGELYDNVKRLTRVNFFDLQVKHLTEMASCYMNGGRVNITLETAMMLKKQKELKLILTVENTGNNEIIWSEVENFDIVAFNPLKFYYNHLLSSLVDDWKNTVRESKKVIEGGENATIELIIPINFDGTTDDYILGFQLITNGHKYEFTNEDFAFILDWDKVEIIND